MHFCNSFRWPLSTSHALPFRDFAAPVSSFYNVFTMLDTSITGSSITLRFHAQVVAIKIIDEFPQLDRFFYATLLSLVTDAIIFIPSFSRK